MKQIKYTLYVLLFSFLCGCQGISVTVTAPSPATTFPTIHIASTATRIPSIATSSPDLDKLKGALYEIHNVDFHFVYTSLQKNVEGDANLNNYWLQYTVITPDGKNDLGIVNGDWVIIYKVSIIRNVGYHYLSNQWTLASPSETDATYYDIGIALAAISSIETKPNTWEVVGSDNISGQDCLHYKDMSSGADNAGDFWITKTGSHLAKIVSQQTAHVSIPQYKVVQIEVDFSNWSVPFMRIQHVIS